MTTTRDIPTSPRLMTVRAAAAELAISERHLRGLILAERVPAVRIARCVRVAREVVERLAREGVGP